MFSCTQVFATYKFTSILLNLLRFKIVVQGGSRSQKTPPVGGAYLKTFYKED